MFRNVTLKCLTEIAGVSVSQYEEQFVTLFTLTMCQLKQVSEIWDAALHKCLKDWNQDLNPILIRTDASFEYQYSTGLCQWKGRWAEFHPEPQSLPLYFPERAWAAHWEEAEPQRDINGGMKDTVQWKMLHRQIFSLASYVHLNGFVLFCRLCIICCWYQRWKKLRSSKFVLSTGTIWLLSCTERVHSLLPLHPFSLATSTLMFHHADSSTFLFFPRWSFKPLTN